MRQIQFREALKEAMTRLQAMDTVEVYAKSQTIYQTATLQRSPPNIEKNRYNGIRPNYNRDSVARVSTKDYPDPTNYGWTFTGSSLESFVEFYEKEIIEGGWL